MLQKYHKICDKNITQTHISFRSLVCYLPIIFYRCRPRLIIPRLPRGNSSLARWGSAARQSPRRNGGLVSLAPEFLHCLPKFLTSAVAAAMTALGQPAARALCSNGPAEPNLPPLPAHPQAAAVRYKPTFSRRHCYSPRLTCRCRANDIIEQRRKIDRNAHRSNLSRIIREPYGFGRLRSAKAFQPEAFRSTARLRRRVILFYHSGTRAEPRRFYASSSTSPNARLQQA